MNDEFDPLESLIDRALDSYTPRRERPGLEYLILASATAERAPWWREWKPAWALAAALLLVAAVVPAWFRLAQPGGGAAQPPAIASLKHPPRPAIGPLAAAGPVRKIRGFTAPNAGEELAALAKPNSELHARPASVAGGSESVAAGPIELKPITIAPIQIRALN
ncbi:MAG: hypothetical protein ABSC48_03955 [Terracidiphilus sp.]|jgi:hypothetical protein